MSTVVFDISVSLDGFITASGRRPEEPMGDGGQRLHQQAFGEGYIRAGLIDEISIHLVPELFGSGTRMFEHLGGEHVQLEPIKVIETRAATHLRFRIVK